MFLIIIWCICEQRFLWYYRTHIQSYIRWQWGANSFTIQPNLHHADSLWWRHLRDNHINVECVRGPTERCTVYTDLLCEERRGKENVQDYYIIKYHTALLSLWYQAEKYPNYSFCLLLMMHRHLHFPSYCFAPIVKLDLPLFSDAPPLNSPHSLRF